MRISRDIMSGITMASGTLATITTVALMLQQAGMDFAGSFTACILFSLVATLVSVHKGSPVMLTPSLTITGYLVFIAAISHGLGWQVVLGISFLASVLGLLAWQVGRHWLKKELGSLFSWSVNLSLAVFLIYLGLKMGRIIITSTWQITMLGDRSDPLMYWSMVGVVMTIAFMAGSWRCALPAGMLLTALATLVEGFWVIPAAPFFLPTGWENAVGQLSLVVDNPVDSIFFMVTAFSLSVMLSAVHWSTAAAFVSTPGVVKRVKMLFAFGALGAVCGVPPLVISPTTVACGHDRRVGAWTAAVILLLALFCEPVLASLADFPAMVVPVLVGSGGLLLLETLKTSPFSLDERQRQAEILSVCTMVLLLPLTGNFATALGCSFIGYALFMSMAGKAQQVANIIWLISGIFALYYIYGSIF